ncbi:DUF3368 domain-containing protein [Luteolibacter arcticus]|uniref:DUF3368 domain-containing protein n=1 Tax=Luteolibacter arcticus TaxID=1581411 RepID=A0ABT3GFE4_9BACT|nr:DUF3368 domain-containing protein [Luteolibacter arcticus]MCW1922279.1 DUF3368 domain-containing protein [Luteolibacter arcticus]
MIVVCDASPLIFLAKLGRLELIRLLPTDRVVVLQCVKDEVLGERASFRERVALTSFLASVETASFSECGLGSKTLSASDRTTLTYAVKHRADLLLADERLLRRIAKEEGIPTIGTLGLLMLAVEKGALSAVEARADLDRAVASHGFRISAELYREVIAALGI